MAPPKQIDMHPVFAKLTTYLHSRDIFRRPSQANFAKCRATLKTGSGRKRCTNFCPAQDSGSPAREDAVTLWNTLTGVTEVTDKTQLYKDVVAFIQLTYCGNHRDKKTVTEGLPRWKEEVLDVVPPYPSASSEETDQVSVFSQTVVAASAAESDNASVVGDQLDKVKMCDVLSMADSDDYMSAEDSLLKGVEDDTLLTVMDDDSVVVEGFDDEKIVPREDADGTLNDAKHTSEKNDVASDTPVSGHASVEMPVVSGLSEHARQDNAFSSYEELIAARVATELRALNTVPATPSAAGVVKDEHGKGVSGGVPKTVTTPVEEEPTESDVPAIAAVGLSVRHCEQYNAHEAAQETLASHATRETTDSITRPIMSLTGDVPVNSTEQSTATVQETAPAAIEAEPSVITIAPLADEKNQGGTACSLGVATVQTESQPSELNVAAAPPLGVLGFGKDPDHTIPATTQVVKPVIKSESSEPDTTVIVPPAAEATENGIAQSPPSDNNQETTQVKVELPPAELSIKVVSSVEEVLASIKSTNNGTAVVAEQEPPPAAIKAESSELDPAVFVPGAFPDEFEDYCNDRDRSVAANIPETSATKATAQTGLLDLDAPVSSSLALESPKTGHDERTITSLDLISMYPPETSEAAQKEREQFAISTISLPASTAPEVVGTSPRDPAVAVYELPDANPASPVSQDKTNHKVNVSFDEILAGHPADAAEGTGLRSVANMAGLAMWAAYDVASRVANRVQKTTGKMKEDYRQGFDAEKAGREGGDGFD